MKIMYCIRNVSDLFASCSFWQIIYLKTPSLFFMSSFLLTEERADSLYLTILRVTKMHDEHRRHFVVLNQAQTIEHSRILHSVSSARLMLSSRIKVVETCSPWSFI